MARKREFGEGPIFTITNYIFWLLGGSFYFGVCNILFLFIFMTPIENPDISYLYILMISLIPAGPAITALMSVMGKLVREKDINITRDYFKAYKQNFKQSMAIWLMELGVIAILLVDISFFRSKSYGVFMIPIMYVLTVIVISMGFYAFPIISRFYFKTKDVIKLSFYYTIVKFKITFLNISALIIGGFLIYKYPSVSIFFAASGVCYLIMYYEKDILKDLELQVTKNDKNKNNTEHEKDEDKIFSDKLFDEKR